MSTAINTGTPNRVAAGVTAAYLRDLTRRPAAPPGDGRRRTIRGDRVAAARPGRDRDDCGQRRASRAAAVQ